MISKKIKILYLISISIFFIYSFYLYANYANIKEVVATHYTIKGEADGFGNKIHLVYLNIAHIVLLLVLFFGIKNPKYANYPNEITNENRDSSYRKMQFFLSLIAILTSLAMSYMIFSEIGNNENSFLYLIGYATLSPILAILYFKDK